MSDPCSSYRCLAWLARSRWALQALHREAWMDV